MPKLADCLKVRFRKVNPRDRPRDAQGWHLFESVEESFWDDEAKKAMVEYGRKRTEEKA